jgi:hypothetical protein
MELNPMANPHELWHVMNITPSDVAMNRAEKVSPRQQEQLQRYYADYRRARLSYGILGLVLASVIFIVCAVLSLGEQSCAGCCFGAIFFVFPGYIFWQLNSLDIAIQTLDLETTQGLLRLYQLDFLAYKSVVIYGKNLAFASEQAYAIYDPKQVYRVYFVGRWIIALEPV